MRTELRPIDGKLVSRAVLLVVGSTLSTFCYALTIRAQIGLGPLFVAQDGLARTVHISIGTAVMVFGVGFILLALSLRSWPGPGTLIVPFLGGATLNAILPLIPVVHGWPLRITVVIVATWLMALGGVLVIAAALGVAAYDAVMLGLHRIARRPIAPIRLGMEISVLACGWFLGGSVGLGTVVTGLLIGPGMQYWLKVLKLRASVQLDELPRASRNACHEPEAPKEPLALDEFRGYE